MATTQYLSRWINKKGGSVDVFQVDTKGKEFEIRGPGRSSSHFYGDYAQLLKKLKSEGYESKSRHEETETIDNFMDKILAEVALKPGQKKKIPQTVKVKLSPAALAALKGDPKTAAERKKVEADLKKHEAEYEKLNALLNQARIKKDQLKKKQRQLGAVVTPMQAKYFSLIEKECSNFVKDMKAAKCFLFRGMNDVGEVVYGKPHENRKPMDTNQKVQERFDAILTAAGFKAKRSNSIFTSGDPGQASNYGDVYLIFPKNGYNFSWSSKHGDWIPSMNDMKMVGEKLPTKIDWEEIDNDILEDNIYMLASPEHHFENMEWNASEQKIKAKATKLKAHPLTKTVIADLKKIKQEFNKLDFYDDEEPKNETVKALALAFKNLLKLNLALKDLKLLNASEVKIINKVILYAGTLKGTKDKPAGVSKAFAEAFIKKHGLKNTDMVGALKSSHEIYVNGEYIAMEFSKFRKAANLYFFNGDVKNVNNDYYDDYDDDY